MRTAGLWPGPLLTGALAFGLSLFEQQLLHLHGTPGVLAGSATALSIIAGYRHVPPGGSPAPTAR